MKIIRGNKKKYSIFLIGCLIFGLIFSNSVMANVSNKPDFDLEMSVTKSEAIVGEDIIINGRIIPKPFETEVPAKEIVLVLDVSGSMSQNVNSECNVIRTRYCTNHNSSDSSHGSNYGHNWKEDYCQEHKTSGVHKGTKIVELKIAANNFIDKMKDVPNLKIGIVTYSKESEIKKNNSSALIDASNTNELKGIINGLSADGGTNTGEGLRKATYLLKSSTESNKSAIKTLVLMSDGMPTYRTVNDRWSNSVNFYLNTDVENRGNTYIVGGGNSDDGGRNTQYAKKIGDIINEQNYNVFSIGYGMDNTGTNKLRDIHKSMSGLSSVDNSLINEEKGFFATSDGAINSVFDQIADKILDSYPINNIDLNITFNSGFSLNIGGNTVRLDTVNYKKVSESKNGKIRYEAEPVPFQFIVKASEPGNQEINSSVNIKFPWDGKTENIPIDQKLNIIIKPNELPPINAKLISDEKVMAESGQVVKLKYQIEADDFTFKDSNNLVYNDVVIVLDVAKDMENKMSIIKNSLWNKLLNNNTLKKSSTQYGIVTYSNKAELKSGLTGDINYLNDNIIKKIGTEEHSNNAKHIGETVQPVIDILEGENSRADAHKNVIFISQGKVSYKNEDIALLKSKGYNIISLETDSTDKQNTLYNMHYDLGSIRENYFNIANGDYNQIENSIMAQIADRIINTTTYKPYNISAKLHFNLGDNFNGVEGIEVQNGNNIIINVPNIRYVNVGDGRYVADEIAPVEFSIMIKENKFGDLAFGQNPQLNKIQYIKILGGNVNIPIKTPVINVQERVSDLVHGLYGGIKNNSVDIIGNGNKTEIAAGSNVTFGAKFIVGGNSTKFNINIDSKLEEVSANNIKVYKTILNGSKLELKKLEADIVMDDTAKNFNVIINNIKEDNTLVTPIKSEIVVVYTGKVSENSKNEDVKNTIRFANEIFKDVDIFTGEKELPDLF